jgi:hypothetical protein
LRSHHKLLQESLGSRIQVILTKTWRLVHKKGSWMYINYCIFILNIGTMVASHIFQDITFDLYLTTCIAMLAFRFADPYPITNLHLFIFSYCTTWWKVVIAYLKYSPRAMLLGYEGIIVLYFFITYCTESCHMIVN